jgi:hypothetical protein
MKLVFIYRHHARCPLPCSAAKARASEVSSYTGRRVDRSTLTLILDYFYHTKEMQCISTINLFTHAMNYTFTLNTWNYKLTNTLSHYIMFSFSISLLFFTFSLSVSLSLSSLFFLSLYIYIYIYIYIFSFLSLSFYYTLLCVSLKHTHQAHTRTSWFLN